MTTLTKHRPGPLRPDGQRKSRKGGKPSAGFSIGDLKIALPFSCFRTSTAVVLPTQRRWLVHPFTQTVPPPWVAEGASASGRGRPETS